MILELQESAQLMQETQQKLTDHIKDLEDSVEVLAETDEE